MGGHGAWHLATHYPDMALAVVSLAAWIRKEDYGDSNLFFRHVAFTRHFLMSWAPQSGGGGWECQCRTFLEQFWPNAIPHIDLY